MQLIFHTGDNNFHLAIGHWKHGGHFGGYCVTVAVAMATRQIDEWNGGIIVSGRNTYYSDNLPMELV